MDKFSMTTPLTGEYFTTVRLAVGGICALAGFDVDSAEDFKVCVTESLLILKRNGFATASVTLTVGEELACEITGEELGGEKMDTPEDEISRALLSALLGSVEFINEADKVVKIQFKG
jgi:hypothetical protein